MNKLIVVILFLFLSSFSFAQSDSELTGMWKSIVQASNKKTVPTYFNLNSDGSYVWGVDSATSEPLPGSSAGTWNLTEDVEIKFIPSDTSSEIRYYKSSGDSMYKYQYYEKDGKKVPVYMLEMDFYIMKISKESGK